MRLPYFVVELLFFLAGIGAHVVYEKVKEAFKNRPRIKRPLCPENCKGHYMSLGRKHRAPVRPSSHGSRFQPARYR